MKLLKGKRLDAVLRSCWLIQLECVVTGELEWSDGVLAVISSGGLGRCISVAWFVSISEAIGMNGLEKVTWR